MFGMRMYPHSSRCSLSRDDLQRTRWMLRRAPFPAGRERSGGTRARSRTAPRARPEAVAEPTAVSQEAESIGGGFGDSVAERIARPATTPDSDSLRRMPRMSRSYQTLLVIAELLALRCAARAADLPISVRLYGFLNAEIEWVRALGGATPYTPRRRVSDGNSRFGIFGVWNLTPKIPKRQLPSDTPLPPVYGPPP